MGGHWKPSSILESMQEAAIAHCDSLNLGRPVLDSMGIAWVLSRCRVEMKRLPHIGETCTVSTWAMPTRHLFFPRAHAFKDAEGAIIGEAYGLWLLMDQESRKAVHRAEHRFRQSRWRRPPCEQLSHHAADDSSIHRLRSERPCEQREVYGLVLECARGGGAHRTADRRLRR